MRKFILNKELGGSFKQISVQTQTQATLQLMTDKLVKEYTERKEKDDEYIGRVRYQVDMLDPELESYE